MNSGWRWGGKYEQRMISTLSKRINSLELNPWLISSVVWSEHIPSLSLFPYLFFCKLDTLSSIHFVQLLLLLLSHFSHVWLCVTPAHHASPSLGFSRQEHWSGLPFPSSRHESEKWQSRLLTWVRFLSVSCLSLYCRNSIKEMVVLFTWWM